MSRSTRLWVGYQQDQNRGLLITISKIADKDQSLQKKTLLVDHSNSRYQYIDMRNALRKSDWMSMKHIYKRASKPFFPNKSETVNTNQRMLNNILITQVSLEYYWQYQYVRNIGWHRDCLSNVSWKEGSESVSNSTKKLMPNGALGRETNEKRRFYSVLLLKSTQTDEKCKPNDKRTFISVSI